MAEVEGRKAIVDAEMEARRKLLEKKEELVSRIFAEAEKKMEETRSSQDYLDMILNLIAEGVASIGGDVTVQFGEKDRDIFTPDAVSAIESHVKESLENDIQLQFQCVGSSISAGVIVTSKDGRIIVDSSFFNRLRRLKEELRGEVSDILLKE
jgi:V-type H+-transporting ATPase subunit E